MKKVLLAFSGGLDTTFCATWLKLEQGYEVHAVTIDTGGFSDEDLRLIESRANLAGVASWQVIDGKKDYYQRCIKYLVFGNVLKNGTYPLSVSAERVLQAILLAEKANQMGIYTIAHGSTGAGNDQVRFDMLLEILLPEVKIITPVRDLKLSREREIKYLTKHNIVFDFSKAEYSINKGLWGTSVGGKETLTSNLPLPEEAWPTPISKSGSEVLSIEFTCGEISAVNGNSCRGVKAIELIQSIAAPYGVGRDIHVGDTIIGIKGRVGFEAAAPLVIIKAHHALEKHVLTKWQLYWKEQLSVWYGNWLHEGQYFEPAMRDIEAMLANTQQSVCGTVEILLHPHHFSVMGISSPYDLMQSQAGQYGEMNNGWTGDDVKGFTKIFGQQVKNYHHLQLKLEKETTA
jgi:argininosuccinate synthase